jgi:hypothetical protein
MRSSVEFLVGLFDLPGTPGVTAADIDGPHGPVVREWQAAGIVAAVPMAHAAAPCPECGEGVPYQSDAGYRCNACRSPIDPRALLLFPLDLGQCLRVVAGHLRLRGGVRPVDDRLWQLGTGATGADAVECFYLRAGPLSVEAELRIGAYRRVAVLHGPGRPSVAGPGSHWLPVVELFGADGSLAPADLGALLRPRGRVRFDAQSGTVWAGDTRLGEVPAGSREYHLLACLAEHLDRYVPYADAKREVLRRAGGTDGADEATFCHGLKRRIKRKWVPDIDRLLATTNKADGYRLRAYLPTP